MLPNKQNFLKNIAISVLLDSALCGALYAVQ